MVERVWIRGSGRAAEMAAEIAEVIGVHTAVGPAPADYSLLIATDQLPLDVSVPSVRVGPTGELQLPRDAALLAQVIVQATVEGAVQGRRLNVAVVGCHGGSGASTAAAKLSAAGDAPVVDLSGHPGGKRRVTLSWNQISISEPPTIGRFRPGSGAPVICDAPGQCTPLASPKAMKVLDKTCGPVVVDAGVWSPDVDQIPSVVTVLLCHRRKAEALLEVVEHSRVQPRLILTTSPSLPEFRWAAQVAGARVARPGAWKKLWKYLSV